MPIQQKIDNESTEQVSDSQPLHTKPNKVNNPNTGIEIPPDYDKTPKSPLHFNRAPAICLAIILSTAAIAGLLVILQKLPNSYRPINGSSSTENSAPEKGQFSENPTSKHGNESKVGAFGRIAFTKFQGALLKNFSLKDTNISVSPELKAKGIETSKHSSIGLLKSITTELSPFAEAKEATEGAKMMSVYAVKYLNPEATTAASIRSMVERFDFLSFDDYPLEIESFPEPGRLTAFQATQKLKGWPTLDDRNNQYLGNFNYLLLWVRPEGSSQFHAGSRLVVHRQQPFTERANDATASAIPFLKSRGLLPEGSLEYGLTTASPDTNWNIYGGGATPDAFSGASKILFVHRKIDGYPVIELSRNIPEQTREGVAFNQNNQIIGINYDSFLQQIDFENFSSYPIIGENEALDRLLDSREIYGVVKLPSSKDPNFPLSIPYIFGTGDWQRNKLLSLLLKNIEMGYYRDELYASAENPDVYVPVYVLSGMGVIEGPDYPEKEAVNVEFYIPALAEI